MLSVRKNILLVIALFALLLASLKSSAGDIRAQVVRVGDGTAKVIFQPVGSADQATVHNRFGEPIGKLNWAASFEVSVTEAALRAATKSDGIDLNSLLQSLGTLQVDDKMLVAAELPVPIKDLDGRELQAGTQVYFALNRLAKEGVVAPVVAWGGKNVMGPNGAANNFNDRLLQSGVQGQRRSTPAASVAAGAPKQGRVSGYDSDSRFPLDPLNELAAAGQKFLTSPTCTMASSEHMITTSHYGHRHGFRTDNGQYATHFHDGVDIAGRAGTPIVAAGAGCISVKDMRFNANASYGLSVVVDHGNGFTSQYSHMQNFSPEIRAFAKTARAGDRYCLARGEQIGNVGSTGNSTGPHLHFGMKYKGKSVNPRNYLLARSDRDLSMTCTALAASNEQLKQYDSQQITTEVAGAFFDNAMAAQTSAPRTVRR